jgi:CRP-like cAMP-binding protein
MSPTTAETQLAQFLAQLPLFGVLNEGQMAEVIEASRSREMPKGSILFFQDDPADVLYVVKSGSVAIFLTSSDGRELVLGEMHHGDSFGELALITGLPRSATAAALVKSELIIIPGRLFLDLLERCPEMARIMLRSTIRRLYASTRREGALAFLDAPARLARILLKLELQTDAPSGYITISQQGLAQRTGLTRQTVAKILGRWRRAGWLITGRGRIVLLNQKALRQVEQQSIT